ncbi:hypothetical protein SNE40_009697 [Patella caerulea]|uniref:Uncharacterized protein n=1 Tax=Patella caerulea TaxID=87958 RepID=A0AAN8Q3L1_PATCE
MPYDDSNIKRMIRDQLERKVGFSKSKKIPHDCKDLIHKILEVNVKKRLQIPAILTHIWLKIDAPHSKSSELVTSSVCHSMTNRENRSRIITDLHLTPEERMIAEQSKSKDESATRSGGSRGLSRQKGTDSAIIKMPPVRAEKLDGRVISPDVEDANSPIAN